MIDREGEAARLLALAEGGHASRLVAPRRYGKTSLLRRALLDAGRTGWATALVDLEGVLSLSSLVVRIERAYDRSLMGSVRRTVDALFRSWKVGLSLGGRRLHGVAAVRTLASTSRVSSCGCSISRPRSSSERERGASLHSTSSRTCCASTERTECSEASSSTKRRLRRMPSRGRRQRSWRDSSRIRRGRCSTTRSRSSWVRCRTTQQPCISRIASGARGETSATRSIRSSLRAGASAADDAGGTSSVGARCPKGPSRTRPHSSTPATRLWRSPSPHSAARWEALSVNEQRVTVALAVPARSLYAEETLRFLGLRKGSVDRALGGACRQGGSAGDGRRSRPHRSSSSSTGSRSAAGSEG